jgi:hypothetical protein
MSSLNTNPFYDYVRGRCDTVPAGYTEKGMRVYRHLVWLGASQMVESNFPVLRQQLGEEKWNLLIADFVRQSEWASHYYGDVKNEFLAYLERQTQPDAA